VLTMCIESKNACVLVLVAESRFLPNDIVSYFARAVRCYHCFKGSMRSVKGSESDFATVSYYNSHVLFFIV